MIRILLLLLGLFAVATSRRCSKECRVLSVQCNANVDMLRCWRDFGETGDYRFTRTSVFGRRAWKNTARNKVIYLSPNSGTDTWFLGELETNNVGNYYDVRPGDGTY